MRHGTGICASACSSTAQRARVLACSSSAKSSVRFGSSVSTSAPQPSGSSPSSADASAERQPCDLTRAAMCVMPGFGIGWLYATRGVRISKVQHSECSPSCAVSVRAASASRHSASRAPWCGMAACHLKARAARGANGAR